ncbi:hypothetical protein [Flavobacterium sp. ASW18X]|nr:hypothetical protein [Flavobacterium sp. ASW18X]
MSDFLKPKSAANENITNRLLTRTEAFQSVRRVTQAERGDFPLRGGPAGQ